MQPTVIDSVVTSLPAHLRPSIEGLLSRPATSRERMIAELDAYTQQIDDAARRRPDLDVNLAEGIVQACRTLLRKDDWGAFTADQRRLVQVVCDYYVDSDDEAGDLDSVFGFDDDAAVLNLALDALHRPELRVRV